MKGIPTGPLAQWGKDLTYYLTPFFCLVNWDMYYLGRGTDLSSGRILYIHTYIYIGLYSIIRVFSPSVGHSLQTQEPRLQFCYGWIDAVASRCFPHRILTLASEHISKDLKRSQGHQCGGWGEWIWLTGPSGLHRNSPQGLKYQFHQGFCPNQRSGNPNHPWHR